MEHASISIRPISTECTRPLRQQILRPNQDFASTLYPHDEKAWHEGAFVRDELVGILSVYPESRQGAWNQGEWRLRGMAVKPEYRRCGVASRLIQDVFFKLQGPFFSLLWCNARTSALQFYHRNGFEPEGQEFDIPGIGPHLRMIKRG